MNARRLGVLILAALACVVLGPIAATAQSAFSGSVGTQRRRPAGRDRRGREPGAHRKGPTVVTDGEAATPSSICGPGIYTVTFTLTGFATLVRDGVELPANVTRADQRRPAGRRPRGDASPSPARRRSSTSRTRSARRCSTRDVLDALPTTRNMQSVGVDRPRREAEPTRRRRLAGDGADLHADAWRRRRHTTMQVDGMMVNSSMGDGNIQAVQRRRAGAGGQRPDQRVGAEVSAGGVRINMIPKDGGNTFSGRRLLRRHRRELAEQQHRRRTAGAGPDGRQLRRPRAGLQLRTSAGRS